MTTHNAFRPFFNNGQRKIYCNYFITYITDTPDTDRNMEKISLLTWQVSFQSAGEFLGAPGRSLLGRYFCPPTPACWACFVV